LLEETEHVLVEDLRARDCLARVRLESFEPLLFEGAKPPVDGALGQTHRVTQHGVVLGKGEDLSNGGGGVEPGGHAGQDVRDHAVAEQRLS